MEPRNVNAPETWANGLLAETALTLGSSESTSAWTGMIGDSPVCLLHEAGITEAPAPLVPGPTLTAAEAIRSRAVDFAASTGCILITVLVDGGGELGSRIGAHLRRVHRLSGTIPHIAVEIGERTDSGRMRASAADFAVAVSNEPETRSPHVGSAADAIEWVCDLVSLLPPNASAPAPIHRDPASRGPAASPEAARSARADTVLTASASALDVVESIADVGPIHLGPAAAGLQTGFLRLRGRTLAYATTTPFADSRRTAPGDILAVAGQMEFCDSYHLPMLIVLDGPTDSDPTDPESVTAVNALVRACAEAATPLVVLLTGTAEGRLTDLVSDRGLITGEVLAWEWPTEIAPPRAPRRPEGIPMRADRLIDPGATGDEIARSLWRWSTVDEPLPQRRRPVRPR